MTLLTLILILFAVGAAAWLTGKATFVNAEIKQLIVFVLLVVAVVVVLKFFGVWSALADFRFGR